MYDELIKNLRNESKYALPSQTRKALIEAADAIEELAAFKASITEGYFYIMRDGVLYEAKVERPKGKSIQLPQFSLPEPPKEGK